MRNRATTVPLLVLALSASVFVCVDDAAADDASVDDTAANGRAPSALSLDDLDIAQLEELLSMVAERALRIEIVARIVENGEVTVWNMELSRLTISGRGVLVLLEGSNVVVQAEFTPYRQERTGGIILVAQGQTWIQEEDRSKHLVYRTAFQSMPIELDEPILFFPLGTEPNPRDANVNIELEVRVAQADRTAFPSARAE
jgi:hypothetical protein